MRHAFVEVERGLGSVIGLAIRLAVRGEYAAIFVKAVFITFLADFHSIPIQRTFLVPPRLDQVGWRPGDVSHGR